MHNFTPISALIGGIIIGLSVVFYFYTTGRLAGISGIFFVSITKSNNRLSNIYFILGLIIGPLIYYNILLPNDGAAFKITHSYGLIISGGLLVGFGTRLGRGCTSGHGICGIGRFSINSVMATGLFVASGMITVTILQQYGIHL